MANTTPPIDSPPDLIGLAAVISALGTFAVSIGLGLKRRAELRSDGKNDPQLYVSYEKLQQMALDLAEETRAELLKVREDLNKKTTEIADMEKREEESRRRIRELEGYLLDHRRYIFDQWGELAEAIRASLEKRKECEEGICQACLDADEVLFECLVKIEGDLQTYRKESRINWKLFK